MKREIDLTPYIPAIMEAAEKTSNRDYLMLSLLGQCGFRRGEVVGNNDRRRIWPIELFTRSKKRSVVPEREKILYALTEGGYTKVEAEDGDYSLIRGGQYVLKMKKEDPLPGLQWEDLREGAIWVKGKGGTQYAQPIPAKLYDRLKAYANGKETGDIFDSASSSLYKLCRKYAKMAGCPDWKLAHPHRFRHAYCQTLRRNKVPLEDRQILMRHATSEMTRHYDGDYSIDEKRAMIQGVFE